MSEVKLHFDGNDFPIQGLVLRQTCTAFSTNPLPPQYFITSTVSSKAFHKFLSALKGEELEVTQANFPDISALCNEFGFELESPTYRIGRLEVAIEELKIEIRQLSTQITSIEGIPAVTTELSKTITQLHADVSKLKSSTSKSESEIFCHFPEIFSEFQGKRFSLLWRGSRDGFGSKEFHGRCDGHGNTLTVIFDTKGNIFGGFTPLKWNSRTPVAFPDSSNSEVDDNLKSFLFTLKNPHNIPAKRFTLKAEMKYRAIICNYEWAPRFYSIWISDNCNANTDSRGYFFGSGDAYINDT
jgi:hypothetical protein